MTKLILIRHGQSTWNAENRFTGWVDVDLSDKGVEEAEKSGQIIKDLNIKKMILVSRSKKKIIGLDGYGIKIIKQEIIKWKKKY